MQNKITQLNEFQKEFIKWARDKKRMFNIALPGQGKSLATTGFFLFLRKSHSDYKMVVFTKTKAMVAFEKANVGHWQVTKITNGDALKQFYSMTEFYSDIYLINPTLLTRLADQPQSVKKHFFDLIRQSNLVVIDEAHDFRNYKSRVTQCLKKTLDYYQRYVDADNEGGHRIILMDATPVYRNLENWYSMFDLLEPRLFVNYWSFCDRYCIMNQRNAYVGQRVYSVNGTSRVKKSITFNEIVGYKNVEELNSRIEPYLFRWQKTDFHLDFQFVTYQLNAAEQQKYQVALKGLGLDKEYRVLIQDPYGKQTSLYRDKHDIFYLSNGKHQPKEVLELAVGTKIMYNGTRHTVLAVQDKKKDATHAVRMIKLQQSVSVAEEKQRLLLEQVRGCINGCLIYCTYHETVQAVYQNLVSASLGRRIVVLTGETKDFDTIVKTLNGSEIVIGTRVIGQSLDFYTDNIIFYEPLTQMGAYTQTLGRATRANSPFRDIKITTYMRPLSIEEYFYNRLRLSLKNESNEYLKNLPVSVSLEGIDPNTVDVTYLKEHFLWNKQ